MRPMILAVALMLIAVGTMALAVESQPEPRPSQIAMQARAGWLKAMGENLAASKFDDVACDAAALADQTRKAGESHPDPLGRELTLKVSTLARTIADAAGRRDAGAAQTGLGEIKATCGACHDKFRPKP